MTTAKKVPGRRREKRKLRRKKKLSRRRENDQFGNMEEISSREKRNRYGDGKTDWFGQIDQFKSIGGIGT